MIINHPTKVLLTESQPKITADTTEPRLCSRTSLPILLCLIPGSSAQFTHISSSSFPPLSLLLPRLGRNRARHGPEEPAAHHRRQEGLDQHPGAAAQDPAPELPGPRLPGQSPGRGPHGGLLHQRLVGGKHQGDYEPLACLSVCLSALLLSLPRREQIRPLHNIGK